MTETEMEEHYYNKGKNEGYIMGLEKGQKIVSDILNKRYTPPPITIKCDDTKELRKFLKDRNIIIIAEHIKTKRGRL